MQLAFTPFRKYADFVGRARRAEFWSFALFVTSVSVVLFVVEGSSVSNFTNPDLFWPYGPLTSLWMLACFLPGWALNVRRLHDTGRSAWWLLINFAPFVGGLVFVVLVGFLDSEQGGNRFGPSPK